MKTLPNEWARKNVEAISPVSIEIVAECGLEPRAAEKVDPR